MIIIRNHSILFRQEQLFLIILNRNYTLQQEFIYLPLLVPVLIFHHNKIIESVRPFSINIQKMILSQYSLLYQANKFIIFNLLMQNNSVDAVIGSYSNGQYAPSVFYLKAGEQSVSSVSSQLNPSYILRHKGYYYLVTQHQDGCIVVLDKNFNVVGKVKTMGDDPCHLSIDDTGTFLVACNYTSGSAIIYQLANHIPAKLHSLIVHEGHSNNPDRQASPHCHTSVFSQDGKNLFIADLGTDILYYYDFNSEKAIWNEQKSIKIEDSGPRTVTRGKPGSKILYLSCELDNTVRVISYKGKGLQQLIAYKVSQNPTNYPSQVHYFSGQLYAGLRGDDKIMVFNQKQDALQVSYSFKVGSFPRHFAVSSQQTIFVACQKGNVVQKYKISPEKVVLQSQISIVTPSVVVLVEQY